MITHITTLESQLTHWLHESTALLKVMTADRDALKAENKVLRDALEAECGGLCNAEYNTCAARAALQGETK